MMLLALVKETTSSFFFNYFFISLDSAELAKEHDNLLFAKLLKKFPSPFFFFKLIN